MMAETKTRRQTMKSNVLVMGILCVLASVTQTGCNIINQLDNPTIIFGKPENGGWGKTNVELIVPKIHGESFADNLCTNATVYAEDGTVWTNQPNTIVDDSQIDYLGVCSDGTSWNPVDAVISPTWVEFCKSDEGKANITTMIPVNGHFRGNIFAVSENETADGQRCWLVAYLDLSQWKGKYDRNNDIIRPDGLGGQVIDFWTTADGGNPNPNPDAPVIEGIYSNVTNGIAYVAQMVKLTGNITGGTEPMTFGWQYSQTNPATDDNGGFADIEDNQYNGNTAHNQTLVILSAGEINSGWYRMIATNAAGSTYSSAFHLTVLPTGGEGEGEGEEGEYTLTTTVQGKGTVSPSGGRYNNGANINMAASPAANWRFAYWMGDLTGTQNPAPIVVHGNLNITAVFLENSTGKALLTTYLEGGTGEVFASVVGPEYTLNTSVTLTAAPDQGYVFDHWSGDLTGTANPATIVMNANKTVTAVLRHATNNDAPSIPLEGQPNSIVRALNESGSFTVIVNGANLTYEWLCNGFPISLGDNPTAGDPTLVIEKVVQENYAGYSCHIYNTAGEVTSNVATLSPPTAGGNAELRVNYDGTTASLTMNPATTSLSQLFFNWGGTTQAACNRFRVYNYAEWHGGNKSLGDGWTEITWPQLKSLENQTGKWIIVDSAKDAKSEWVIIDEINVPAGGWTFPLNVQLANWLADTNNPTKRVRINVAFVETSGIEHYANTGVFRLYANQTLLEPIQSCLDYEFNAAQ